MALETLKGFKKINGFSIMREADRPKYADGSIDWNKLDIMRKESPIMITDSENMISFRIQNGPIREVGVNGCQVDEIVAAALLIVKGLNEKFPCNENVETLKSLYSAQCWLWQRKNNREIRNVEGTNQP